MKKEKLHICENCKQSSFLELLYTWKELKTCKNCYDSFMNDTYSWNNENLAIKLYFETYQETVFLPFLENFEVKFFTEDYSVLDGFETYQEFFKTEYPYLFNESECFELIDIREFKPELDISDISECSEYWNLKIYTKLGIESNLYDSPFDQNPNNMIFSCLYAMDSMIGNNYSKDFAYYYCEQCDRYICGQSPSNGWHVQGSFDDFGFECNKCKEERYLIDGVNNDFNGENIPGLFFNKEDIELNNWVFNSEHLAGDGYNNYNNPQIAIDKIKYLIDSCNYKVLINYTNLAIGGLGGYFEIYIK